MILNQPTGHRIKEPVIKNHLKIISVIATLLFPLVAAAQSYSINWYNVAGGGGMNTTGGAYSLSGTIGQHDASGPLTGGGYQFTGGFWALISVLQTPGAPTLYIRHSGGTVTVFWQNVSGWNLQQNNNLGNGVGWSINSSWTTSNGTNYLNLASPAGNLFYRLQHP
jgi:hypothetical protein